MLTYYFPIFVFLFCEIANVPLLRSKHEVHTFTSCFDDLGCIDTSDKWFNEKYRPKNLEPLDRHTIRTEFLLMKNNVNSSTELLYDVMSAKKETISVAEFKSGTCSIFIIHDFTANGYTGWIKHIVIALTHRTDCNIVSVDWQAGAEPPFEQAIANARVVALETKLFISQLICSFQQTVESIHIIGHGVGAHIAGYVGKYIKGVQRITALDPTGPHFEHMPMEVRLDYRDANYVEVLHTDAHSHKSQGTMQSYGHVDFYFNNAQHQPGCNDSSHTQSFLTLDRDHLQEGHILPACSHKRAFKYYIEAVEDDLCQFIGIKCATYKDFMLSKCDCSKRDNCATFGLEKPSLTTHNNTFFLATSATKPFCLVTYNVNITIAKESQKTESEGFFEMILVDNDDKVSNATSNLHGKSVRIFESGHTYKFLFYASGPPLGRIKQAKVKWNYKSKKVCVICKKSIILHDIGIEKLVIKDDKDKPPTSWLCPYKPEIVMKNGDFIEFLNCEDMFGPEYTKNHVTYNSSALHNNKAAAMLEGCEVPENSNYVTTEQPTSETCEEVSVSHTSESNQTRRSNTESSSEPKAESNTDSKSESNVEHKSESNVEHKSESNVEHKSESNLDTKSENTKSDSNDSKSEDESEAATIQSFKDCFDVVTVVTTTDAYSCENMDPDKVRRRHTKHNTKTSRKQSSGKARTKSHNNFVSRVKQENDENDDDGDVSFVDTCEI